MKKFRIDFINSFTGRADGWWEISAPSKKVALKEVGSTVNDDGTPWLEAYMFPVATRIR